MVTVPQQTPGEVAVESVGAVLVSIVRGRYHQRDGDTGIESIAAAR